MLPKSFFKLSITLSFAAFSLPLFGKHYHLNANAAVYDHVDISDRTFVFRTEKSNRFSNVYASILMYWLVEEGTPLAIKKQFSEWGFGKTRILEDSFTGYRAVVAEHQDFIYFAVRGTKSNYQIITNGQLPMIHMNTYGFEGKVHEGFATEYMMTRDVVTQALVASNAKTKPVIAVGHSRGTTQVFLHMAQFEKKFHGNFKVYAYAAPKLGDKKLTEFLESKLGNRSITINDFLDITPNVPLTQDTLSYLDDEIASMPYLLMEAAKSITSSYEYDFTPGTTYLITQGHSLVKVTDKPEAQREYWSYFGDQLPEFTFENLEKIMKSTPKEHHATSYIKKLSTFR